MAKIVFDEDMGEFDTPLLDEGLDDNPFYAGHDSDYFTAKRGERGGALARQIVEVMETDPSLIDEIPLQEVVSKRHPRSNCLYLPTAVRRRGRRAYRTVYCVDLGQSGGSWVGASLEDQFKKLSILLYGDLMNRALEDGSEWKDMLPAELIVITDHWDRDIAEWVPMLSVWQRLVRSFELFLVAPGLVHRIELDQ